MLQQTRVDTVIPYFERFLEHFPHVDALAAAPLDNVLSLWSGLGYYSRARNLHKAAKMIAAKGTFPNSLEQLRALPGVGPYMAGAIGSIALRLNVPTVDGNIARVLARLHRDDGKRDDMWVHAQAALPSTRAGDHNQALMDLGAIICTPRSPRCTECPIQVHCGAFGTDEVDAYPPAKKRRKPVHWQMAVAHIVQEGKILLGQRKPSGLFGGLYEPPMFRVMHGELAAAAVMQGVGTEMSLHITRTEPMGSIRHVLTHRILDVTVFSVQVSGQPQRGPYQRTLWWNPAEPTEPIGLSTLAKRVLAIAGIQTP